MEDQAFLFREQFRHHMDVMDAKLDRIELNQEHLKELIEHRLNYLEKQSDDHEVRIRAATEGVTQFKVRNGLTTVGSGVLSILAMLKAFFGDLGDCFSRTLCGIAMTLIRRKRRMKIVRR